MELEFESKLIFRTEAVSGKSYNSNSVIYVNNKYVIFKDLQYMDLEYRIGLEY